MIHWGNSSPQSRRIASELTNSTRSSSPQSRRIALELTSLTGSSSPQSRQIVSEWTSPTRNSSPRSRDQNMLVNSTIDKKSWIFKDEMENLINKAVMMRTEWTARIFVDIYVNIYRGNGFNLYGER